MAMLCRPAWLHEIKHDGFRVVARRDGDRVRLYSRPGNDLTGRFPLIVEALANLHPRSCCIIDGEALACDDNGATGATTARSSWLPTQEDSSELLLIAEPVLGLRNRRSERLCDGFLCDHPRSLDGRERNDGADCAHADECDSERNNQSDGEIGLRKGTLSDFLRSRPSW